MFTDQVVPQTAVTLSTDRTQLPLSTVGHLMAAQVGSLREAPPTGWTPVWPLVLMDHLVAGQVTSMVEALPTDAADEPLVKVCESVCLHDTDAGVSFSTDVAVTRLFPCVACLDVQVAVSFVVESFGAVVAGKG